MKQIYYIFLSLLLLCFISCNKDNKPVLYAGHSYDIVQLNDSLAVIVPGLNSTGTEKPYLINLKDEEQNENIIIENIDTIKLK